MGYFLPQWHRSIANTYFVFQADDRCKYTKYAIILYVSRRLRLNLEKAVMRNKNQTTSEHVGLEVAVNIHTQ